MTTGQDDYASEAFDHAIKTLLWSELISFGEGTTDERDGDPFDAHFDEGDLAAGTLDGFQAELSGFVTACWDDLKDMDPGQAGHDFVLTRNGHGAGFWSRDLGARGDRLTAACKKYPEVDLYLGDDEQIYAS